MEAKLQNEEVYCADGQGKFRLVQLSKLGNPEIGCLSVAQSPDVPFAIQRVYWIYDSPTEVIRGHHSHKELEQILVCINGNVTINIEDASGATSVVKLDDPSMGLYLPAGYWRTMQFGSNAVLMCLASMVYKESDYIRDYAEFKKYCGRKE